MATEEFRDAFDLQQRLDSPEDGQPINFTGEMVYSWMFDGDYPTLPALKEAAHLLAHSDSWGPLYNPEVLRDTPVPCAALVYVLSGPCCCRF